MTRLAAILCSVVLAAASCDAGPSAKADALDAAAADAPGADGTQAELDPAAPSDFALGEHPAGRADPKLFFELEDGSTCSLQLGHQGLWMLVLAVRSHDAVHGPADLELEVEVASGVVADPQLAEARFVDAGDGYRYLFDWFVPLEGAHVAGQDATIRLRATDSDGHTRELTRDVFILEPPGGVQQ